MVFTPAELFSLDRMIDNLNEDILDLLTIKDAAEAATPLVEDYSLLVKIRRHIMESGNGKSERNKTEVK